MLSINYQEVPHNVQNVSAEKAPALQGARLPQAYGHGERPQGPGSPPCKGQSEALSLNVPQTVTDVNSF